MTLAERLSEFVAVSRQPEGSSANALALEVIALYLREDPARAADEGAAPWLRDFLGRWYLERPEITERVPPRQLLQSTAEFVRWLGFDCETLFDELDLTIPRAAEIFASLQQSIAQRGGGFGFSEFLSSFDEGGRSRYDVDDSGDTGSLEGYFRLLRIAEGKADAMELITERSVGPIEFPAGALELLEPGYVINLEIVFGNGVWRIYDSGFVYPPGTEIV